MSNAQDILKSIQSKDYFNAKNFINEALMSKMAVSLEEKLVNFAPTLFNEGKKAKKDYDKDGKLESSSAEFLGSRDNAIKKAMAMKEDWTSDIASGYDLTHFLNQYQQTGQMPPELAAFYQQNPPVQNVKKKKYPTVSGQQTINAGYEPNLNNLVEAFQQDLMEMIQEIEESTGDKLTEEEIAEIAQQYLDLLGEMSEEEYEEDEEEDEEDKGNLED